MNRSYARRVLAILGAMLCNWGMLLSPALAEITAESGAAYASLCQIRGVPLPPTWGSNAWKFNGRMEPSELFIVISRPAFVYYSVSPQGLCMTLPRPSTETALVPAAAFGVICQGNNGRVCFWDNARPVPWDDNNGETIVSPPVEMASTNPALLDGTFIGGAALSAPHPGGMCTNCHAGRNPYIVMPSKPTDLRKHSISQDSPVWYDPIVPAGWLQNPGPGNTLDGVVPGMNEGSCLTCHNDTPQAGKFPPVSSAYNDYCNAVLGRAKELMRMPPGGASWPTHWQALTNACFPPPGTPLPADLASFVSQTLPPGFVFTGQPFSISVSFMNTGAITWAGRHTVAAIQSGPGWNSTPTVVGSAGVPIKSMNPVTQTVSINAPDKAGTYKLSMGLFAPSPSGEIPIGTSPEQDVVVADPINDASVDSLFAPGSLPSGAAGAVSVVLRNTGNTMWLPGTFLLRLSRINRVSLPVNFAPLPGTVPPGGTITLFFTVICASSGTGGFGIQMSGPTGPFGQSTGRTLACH